MITAPRPGIDQVLDRIDRLGDARGYVADQRAGDHLDILEARDTG